MNPADASPGRVFGAAAAAVALLVAGLCLFVATREWFSRDDFAFLALARDEGWSWLEVYLPLEERFWPFYRPLGMETFFRVGVGLFGLEAFGFFAVALAFHFASGLWVWRLALQLGFAAPVAIATALLSVSRHPTLAEIFYGSIFHYVAVGFFSLAVLSLFLDYTRRGLVDRQAGSCVALVLALLCNEIAVTLPAVLVLVSTLADGRSARAPLQAMRHAAPQLAITLGYLVLRFGILPAAGTGVLYQPFLGRHVPWNLAYQVQHFFGDDRVLAVTALLLLAVLAVCLVTPTGRTKAGGWLLRTNVACIGWTILTLAPFALLPFAQRRFSMTIEAPLCLLIGASGSALWRVAAVRWRPVLEAGLLGLVLASIPYATLLARAADPVGAYPRRFVGFVAAQDLAGTDARVVVLFGSEGLASAAQAERFRYLAYGGGIFRALYPESELSLRFHDLDQTPPRNVLRPGSVYAVLRPDLTLELADEELLARELPRGFRRGGG